LLGNTKHIRNLL